MDKTLSDFDLDVFDPSRDRFIAEADGTREYEHAEGELVVHYAVNANGTRRPVSMFPLPEAGNNSAPRGGQVLR